MTGYIRAPRALLVIAGLARLLAVSSARYVRITDRPDLPDVFDIDAVAIVNAACP